MPEKVEALAVQRNEKCLKCQGIEHPQELNTQENSYISQQKVPSPRRVDKSTQSDLIKGERFRSSTIR